MPIPTPPSLVRTIAEVCICSESSQKLTCKRGAYWERDHGVNVTAASGDVLRLGPSVRTNAFSVTDLDGKRDSVPWKLSLLFHCRRISRIRNRVVRPLGCPLFLPGTGFPVHHTHSHLDFQHSSFCCPYHFASGFLIAELHSDDVAGAKLFFKTG